MHFDQLNVLERDYKFENQLYLKSFWFIQNVMYAFNESTCIRLMGLFSKEVDAYCNKAVLFQTNECLDNYFDK